MEALSFICLFILLPIWGGYTGENMALWALVTALLFLPPATLAYREHKKGAKSNEHNHKNHYHSAAEHGGN